MLEVSYIIRHKITWDTKVQIKEFWLSIHMFLPSQWNITMTTYLRWYIKVHNNVWSQQPNLRSLQKKTSFSLVLDLEHKLL